MRPTEWRGFNAVSGFLEDHLQIAPKTAAVTSLPCGGHTFDFEGARRSIHHADDAFGECCLATARFADQAEHFSLVDMEGDVRDSGDLRPVGPVPFAKVADLPQADSQLSAATRLSDECPQRNYWSF
jgi:hypothetical protein